MTEHYTYKTPHPKIKGVAKVQTAKGEGHFLVDFNSGTCECAHGSHEEWHHKNQAWVDARWCVHKLKALSTLVANAEDPNVHGELQRIYFKKLSERYIIWEAVSAFHKELRRGDADQARYWAMVVAGHRGLNGVVRYMLNIMFEETRDLDLYKATMILLGKGQLVPLQSVLNLVTRFCAAPKKWELPWRLKIFTHEMSGYKQLIEKYGNDVAKGKDIIDYSEADTLLTAMLDGFSIGKQTMVQYGLKGYFKTKSNNHEKHKLKLFNALTDVLNGDAENGFKYNEASALRIHTLHLHRIRHFGGIGYHELNVLADALCGEPYTVQSSLSETKHRMIMLNKKDTTPEMGILRNIPLYTQDNHTYRGKALMKKWAATELQPRAKQEHIDFRWCGAYLGVCWRYLAYDQHQSCEVGWHEVKWNKPTWLWNHVNGMFY